MGDHPKAKEGGRARCGWFSNQECIYSIQMVVAFLGWKCSIMETDYVSCYDLNVNRTLDNQQIWRGERLWADICNIKRIDAYVERTFEVGIKKLVGDGQSTWFWEDVWVDEVSLMRRFPSLFFFFCFNSELDTNSRLWFLGLEIMALDITMEERFFWMGNSCVYPAARGPWSSSDVWESTRQVLVVFPQLRYILSSIFHEAYLWTKRGGFSQHKYIS